MSRVTARQHENTQEKYGQGGVDAESRTTSAVGLRLSERQAKFFTAHFMRDGKRTTAGDLFRDWYPHAACAEAGLRSSKYDLQVLSSLKEAILVVCQDPAAIHSATWNFKDSLRIKTSEFMDIILGDGWSQYVSIIDAFRVFLTFKPCVESDGRVGKIVVLFTTTATMGEGRNDDCPQRIDKAVAYVKAKMRQREATLPSLWEAVETTVGPIDLAFISSRTAARPAPAISSSCKERIELQSVAQPCCSGAL